MVFFVVNANTWPDSASLLESQPSCPEVQRTFASAIVPRMVKHAVIQDIKAFNP